MVMSKGAVGGFLTRTLADSEKAKGFTDRALEVKLRALRPIPRFATPPFRHQKVCFLLALKYGSYFLMIDMGLGKSKVCLDLIGYRQQEGTLKQRALVLVPWSSMVGQWLEEVSTHTPYLKAMGLEGKRFDREEILCDTKHDILVMTYQGYLSLVCARVGGKYVFDVPTAKLVEQQFGFVVFDESTALSNHETLTYRAARRLSKAAPYRICLSGAPFNRNPEDLWSQFYVVDHGATLGPTLGLYRAAFFEEKVSHWSPWPDHVFDRRLEEDLHRTLRHRSVRFSEAECLDIPKTVGGIESPRGPMIRSAPMSKEARRYYNGILKEFREAGKNYQLVESAYHRMRQIASGYLTLKGEDGEKLLTCFESNPKLDMLGQMLEEIPQDSKILIFTYYHITGDIVCDRLKKDKHKFVRLYGNTRNKGEILQQFKQDKSIRILQGSSAIAFGLNLQAANYTLFYESPDAVTTRRQMERRTRRPGQTKPTFIYDLITANTIEGKILSSLEEGKNMHDVLLDGLPGTEGE